MLVHAMCCLIPIKKYRKKVRNKLLKEKRDTKKKLDFLYCKIPQLDQQNHNLTKKIDALIPQLDQQNHNLTKKIDVLTSKLNQHDFSRSKPNDDKKSIYHGLNILADKALEKLINEYEFQTVLDIGCGEGVHADIFLKNKKNVIAIDYGHSPYFEKNKNKIDIIIGDFNKYEFTEKYDCVWCSHLLEHQLNTNVFLNKINSALKDNGVLAITVPPMDHRVLGGHVSYWNAGILLYQLVLAGFDCSEASIKSYGYNISVIIRKKKINILEKLVFDNGDIKNIQKYLPKNIIFKPDYDDVKFDGRIEELNW